ncbi:MAG: DUF6483 family protein [Thermoflexales bacterium]|nr:DUF6483 family protein [Thermoflexales bacterium]
MYSSDYVKRMIEQFGAFLMALKQLLTENRLQEAREQIDLAYRQVLGFEPDFARAASEDTLLLMTSLARIGDLDRVLALADVLAADGDWHALAGDLEIAETCYQKALHLLIDALLQQPFGTSKEYVDRVDALIDRLEAHDALGEPSLVRIFRYAARLQRYADAEDALFHLLEVTPEVERWRAEGIQFYQSLLALRDHELLLGGLSRDEVLAALEELSASDNMGEAV